MSLDGTWRPGTYKRKTAVTFNGLARPYLLHIPQKTPKERWPLIMMIHGAFSTAKEIEQQTGFSQLADKQGFCVVYPNGIGIFGLLQHWNAGHCCGKAAKDNVDDGAYLDAVIRDASRLCPIDQTRVFVVGHSNGGMLVHRYAAERSQHIAGAAVVAGAINSKTEKQTAAWRPAKPARPVPILLIHGTHDRSVPLQGGESPAKSDGRIYAPLSEARDFWKTCNDTHAAVRVERLPGWGHNWPGPFFTDQIETPDSMRGYDAAQVIWDFFKVSGRNQLIAE